MYTNSVAFGLMSTHHKSEWCESASSDWAYATSCPMLPIWLLSFRPPAKTCIAHMRNTHRTHEQRTLVCR